MRPHLFAREIREPDFEATTQLPTDFSFLVNCLTDDSPPYLGPEAIVHQGWP